MSDLISRKRIEFELCESNMPKKYRDFCRRVINSESLSPTIDTEPVRHGHWIMNEDDELYCSVCGDIASLDSGEYFYRDKIRFDDSFYCSNCGAKMDEN